MEVINIEYRTIKRTFRITPSELNKIEKSLIKANMTLSEYARQSMLKDKIIVIEDLKDFIKELRSLNRNINQLAILAHKGNITSINLENVQAQMIKMWEAIDLLTTVIKK
jgi:MoxR-like ATPase